MHLSSTLAGVAICACLVAAPAAVLAEDLATPTGTVMLTVSGDIAVTNAGDTAQFDREMLEALPARTIETTTIWTEGPQIFTGVPLAALLDVVAADEVTIHATAINDYAVDIPFEDWSGEGPMLAYARNGAPMSVRDKGPLWIVYPYDSDAEYRSEVIYSRSIWQLDRIIVGE